MKKDINDKISEIIERQRKSLKKEIIKYQENLHGTIQVYGCGGAYNRQEAAIQKREKQLEELDDFERQLRKAKKCQEVRMYIFGCRNCGGITMVDRKPFNEWHECPVCRKMIYIDNLKSTRFQIVDTGEAWQEQIRKITEEE